jgi:hypothetical protein
MAGSTFSVRRHSSAVFRDLAAIWLRSRMARGAQPGTPELCSPRLRSSELGPLPGPPPHRDLHPDLHRDLLAAGATTA